MAKKGEDANTMVKPPQRLMCAAIDFGTTYSGYAFSMKSNQTQIFCPHWKGSNYQSMKTPTCLLLDSDQKFDSFGYVAQDRYAEITGEDQQDSWYYFKNFKMKLHSKKHPMKRGTKLMEEGGKSLPAMKVFSTSIRYLKEEFEKEKKKQGKKVHDEEITWVLTVPAIWDEEAKQFMRVAAEEAGIPSDQLVIALEPEAASVYAKDVNVKREQTEDEQLILSPYDPGTKFMVVDLGGGTVDITVREVMKDRTLKELYGACGNAKGGNTVNKDMLEFLTEIIGDDIMKEFKMTQKAGYFDLEKEIETKKRAPEIQDQKIPIVLPGTLLDLYSTKKGCDLEKCEKLQKDFKKTVSLKHARLKVDLQYFPLFFKKSVDSILSNIREILSQDFASGLKDVILVGGYADCPTIRRAIESVFEELSFVIPHDAGLAVLKGAVLYGHNPNVVSARMCRYTYGTEVHRYFLDGKDDESKKKVIDGVPYCTQVFNKLAEIGQTFRVGSKVVTEVYPIRADLIKMPVKLYKSTEKNPHFVTDKGSTYMGQIVVDMPDTTQGMERCVKVYLKFGETELKLEAIDQSTGTEATVSLDLLS
ncbi:hypothetical protein KUTeg_024165 [Tegillarca granosa]|uniref:Uncharacterized protein n=1 Tax=Tegillarca granosa TaxID=220873 RepID=A0ABQ9DWI8_TEGGR|nr:hypothetical protein KUTeg_024165 [Tegillarca granosa]